MKLDSPFSSASSSHKASEVSRCIYYLQLYEDDCRKERKRESDAKNVDVSSSELHSRGMERIKSSSV